MGISERVDDCLNELAKVANRLRFTGLVLYHDIDDMTYTFFKLYDQWIVISDRDKKILLTRVMSAEEIKHRYNFDVTRFV